MRYDLLLLGVQFFLQSHDFLLAIDQSLAPSDVVFKDVLQLFFLGQEFLFPCDDVGPFLCGLFQGSLGLFFGPNGLLFP